jgi:hypothetical protein
MDIEVLKKRVSTYRTQGGQVRVKDPALLMEILVAWEQWTGPATGFASALGVHRKVIPTLIGKAKRLRREGQFPAEVFKEIRIEGPAAAGGGPACVAIELGLADGRVIRFPQVDHLVEFLKKAA